MLYFLPVRLQESESYLHGKRGNVAINHKDRPDEELARQLNEKFGEENEEELVQQPGKEKPLYFKLAVLFVMLAFAALALGSLLHLFAWPSFSLLRESRQLLQDPLVREMQESVVSLRVFRGEARPTSSWSQGSGFNICPQGLIVTNRHVIEKAWAVEVFFPGMEAFEAREWRKSQYYDLAVIKLNAENLPFVDIEKDTWGEPGDKVIIIGNPRGFTRTAMEGEILEEHQGYSIEGSILEIEAPIQPGSSGSPVFNKDGKAIAVVFASLRHQEGEEQRGLAVPVKYLEEILPGN